MGKYAIDPPKVDSGRRIGGPRIFWAFQPLNLGSQAWWEKRPILTPQRRIGREI